MVVRIKLQADFRDFNKYNNKIKIKIKKEVFYNIHETCHKQECLTHFANIMELKCMTSVTSQLPWVTKLCDSSIKESALKWTR